MDRRETLTRFFGALALLVRVPEFVAAPLTPASVAGDPESRVETLLHKELSDFKEGDETLSLSVLRVQYAPSVTSRPHIHPSPAFVYVVRGTIESQLEREELRRYTPGQYFFEAARQRHIIARNASSAEPAEFLGVFVGKTKAPLTVPFDDAERATMSSASALYLRFALGITFLYSVGDRFGLWGPPGTHGVNWGDFNHFLLYTGKITAFMPHAWTSTLGWCATVLETVFGICLIVGLYMRQAALGSGILLSTFALSMTATTGLGSALTLSVFSASAGAFVLATTGVSKLSIDNALRKRSG